MALETDVKALIDKAKLQKEKMGDDSADLFGTYIDEVEQFLPYIKGETELSSSQKELYKRLKAAVIP
ncbi:MAG: hypothetical protein ACD_80C00150G0006 [uncultured bacterium (gcode 4)]|uniref:Uncharacterized protein n=1 Tax=uncultured bacterium (gcode 4) TaxID=1234023 RepID=K1YHG0_9BACT|nr:MAG: hypothetical protein ACD_80C00150G0006 [uncultured bacterium (gcode 4)]HBB03966.1 hypothetical protein [Candidatus Gracilibacteria bacterium]